MFGTPDHHIIKGHAANISYYEWGPKNGRPILLLHATGFHARVWDRTIAHLGEGFRIIAVDLRGHGLSGKTGVIKSWEEPARDVAELIERLKLTHIIAAGHSMGGHVATQLALMFPERFDGLVLLDPVMFRPETYEADPYGAVASVQEHPVARRRNKWANWQELYRRLENQHPYSLWQQSVLEDYCRFGVLPAADGVEMELACPPATEASIYIASARVNLLPRLDGVTCPVTILRAKGRDAETSEGFDFAISPTWEGLANAFPRGTDIYLPQLTHFIPMQDPALVASTIISASEHGAALEGAAHE